MKRSILITGSTDGIGKLVAVQLAKEGHDIYLHGRNATKLSEVVEEIKSQAPTGNIKGYVADFSDLDAVKEMASQVKSEVPKLDVLINNAGIYKSVKADNKNGFDIRMVVNYLAPYILTKELLPLLKKGKAPRLINLSSAAQSPVSEDVLLGKQKESSNETYAQSKLALTMWSFRLAETQPDIAVIPVNPGSLLNTNMVKEAFGHHWSSADKGSNILYDLAVSEVYNDVTGKYFDNDKGAFGNAHPDAYNNKKIDNLIKVTENILAD